MITEKRHQKMVQLRDAHHAGCIVCGSQNKRGLKLSFHICEDGSIEGRFPCRRMFQGYDGLLHGGVISAVLDSAMTNCLFAHGITAVTGELTVRFLHPVLLGREVVVRAKIDESCSPLHRMEANLIQGNRLTAHATAKFVENKNARSVLGRDSR